MTKTMKRVFAGISALAIISGVAVGGWAINEYAVKDNNFKIEASAEDNGGAEVENNIQPVQRVQSVSMNMLSASTNAITEGVTKQITATITPSTATNKAVDWSIAWVGDESEDISDYLTVTPTSNGALTANVTCKKSFRGKSALITVTARDGGVTATCAVSYEGEPSAFVVNNASNNENVDCNFRDSVSVPVDLTNVFGDVGEEFLDDIEVTEVQVTGTCYTYDTEYDIYGFYEESNALCDAYALSELHYQTNSGITADKTFEVEYADGTLTVTSTHYLNSDFFAESYWSGNGGNSTGVLDRVENCAVYVTLSCNGIKGYLTVHFESGVNGITVTPSITF